MSRRFLRLFTLVVAAVLVAAPGPPAAPRRIVAIGDVHGDHGAWSDLVRAARLVDANGRWAGGDALVVQTGDIVDRGPDSLRIIRHLMRLQREAGRAGGRVVALVGNHEAMMMTGDLRYVHPGEYAAMADAQSPRRRSATFEANRPAIEAAYRARQPGMAAAAIRDAWLKANPPGKIEHQLAWSPAGELGRWTLANPAVVKLGDSLFVHGGISAAYAALGPEEINRRVRSALAAGDTAPQSIINDPAGPLWYRGLVDRAIGDQPSPPPAPPPASAAPAALATPAAAPPRPTIEQELALVLAATGARRIVVGHTPSLGGIKVRHGGRLVQVDTGASRHYGGQLAYLEIVGQRVTAHRVARSAVGKGGKGAP